MTRPSVAPPSPAPRWSALTVGAWRWWYAVLGAVLVIGGLALINLPGLNNVWGQALQFVLYALIAVLLPWVLSRRAFAADWGWNVARPWRAAFIMGALTALLVCVVNVIEARDAAAAQASDTVLRGFGFGQSAAFDIGMVLCIVALAPWGEEMLFRGLLYRSLRDGLARYVPVGVSAVVGAALSAWLFASSHGGEGFDQQLWLLAGMGLLAVLAYEWTGSIIAPVMLHSINNSVTMITGLRQPGVALAHPSIEVLAWAGPLLALGLLAVTAMLHRVLARRSRGSA
ncbi:CPBP family intramembrane glutamic endopeptidase [Ottowia testudinis]|uniref:CPBP family intramembrane metalloprotease n=1 Tax=Ottowia testudinis TaxID=2816950 RepID=A0A975CJE5_9BURK|nr:type II CAAX endopeptidase family protein [Ottowia testudinis]QTD46857.1 CPBP family intramembrane metalloprotease [Ottowia testudinis]